MSIVEAKLLDALKVDALRILMDNEHRRLFDIPENIAYLNCAGNSLRFAPHLNIDQNDLDRVMNVLGRLLKR